MLLADLRSTDEQREKETTREPHPKSTVRASSSTRTRTSSKNFRIDVPEAFNFGFDVCGPAGRAGEPEKRALVWCDDHDDERTFTFTDLMRLSNQAANAFSKLGIGRWATWS